jgi:hypothetical protein
MKYQNPDLAEKKNKMRGKRRRRGEVKKKKTRECISIDKSGLL